MPKDKHGPSRKISLQTPDDILKRDLETLKQEAFELGASMVEIIPAKWVEIDERVRLKCSVPLCPYYDKNPYCPPQGPSTDFMREAIRRYTWALLFALDVIPPEEFADRSIEREAVIKWGRKCLEITSRIETLAFGRGYYLAMGFGQGSCLKYFVARNGALFLEVASVLTRSSPVPQWKVRESMSFGSLRRLDGRYTRFTEVLIQKQSQGLYL